MLNKYYLIFLHLLCFTTSFASPTISITGSIEYALENNNKEIITILGSINADTLKQCIEELLLENQWKIKEINKEKNHIFSEETETRAYDFGSSNSGATIDFTVASTKSASTNCNTPKIHPNGKYLLACGDGVYGANTQIFAISETGSALYLLPQCNQYHGSQGWSAYWHPSGNYYNLCGSNSQNLLNNTGTVTFDTSLRIYQFDETNKKSTLLPYAQSPHGAQLFESAWHPSGNYLAVGGDAGTNAATLRVYSFFNNISRYFKKC